MSKIIEVVGMDKVDAKASGTLALDCQKKVRIQKEKSFTIE